MPTIAATPTVNLALSLALATALVALMAILLATSLLAVKQRLKPSAWKGVQRLAYPFYLLMYVHLALLLLPSALSGKETALVSLLRDTTKQAGAATACIGENSRIAVAYRSLVTSENEAQARGSLSSAPVSNTVAPSSDEMRAPSTRPSSTSMRPVHLGNPPR